jgi:hypothetical protein
MCIYIYITQKVTKFNDQRSSPPLLVRHPWSAEGNPITRPWDWFVLDASLCQLGWYYDLALLWKLKAKTAKMHSVCKVSLPGTPLSCMLKVNGFSLNPQTPQTLFHLIRKVETCCSNVKVLKFPAFAITANCSSRGQITFTLPIGIQFQSFPKLSKAYVQRTFGHKTNIKTNSARKDRKEAPGSCLRGASFECQSRMTQYTWTEQSQEFALYINIVIIININIYI